MYLFLDSITCIKQDDFTGSDDIYMVINEALPHTVNVGEIATGETKQISRDITLSENSQYIEIWERETLMPNDLLGTINFLEYSLNTEQEVIVDNGSATYKLWFSVVEENL